MSPFLPSPWEYSNTLFSLPLPLQSQKDPAAVDKIMKDLDTNGDGQVDFEEFMTILGPKLLSSDNREGFLGTTIDNIFWQVREPITYLTAFNY